MRDHSMTIRGASHVEEHSCIDAKLRQPKTQMSLLTRQMRKMKTTTAVASCALPDREGMQESHRNAT